MSPITTSNEEGEQLICSTCKQIILQNPNAYHEKVIRLRYLQHLRACQNVTQVVKTADIEF